MRWDASKGVRLSDVIVRLFCHFSRVMVVEGWPLGSSTSIFRRRKKEDPGNYKPSVIPSILPELLQSKCLQMLLVNTQKIALWSAAASLVVRRANHAWLTALPLLQDCRDGKKLRAVNVVYIDFSVTFPIACCSHFTTKWLSYVMGKWTVR